MPIAFIAHAFYYTAMSYLMSGLAAYIPIAKARGFSPLFGKADRIQITGLRTAFPGRLRRIFVLPADPVLQPFD